MCKPMHIHKVHREFGPGFPKQMNREPMKVDSASAGLHHACERVQDVLYRERVVGRFRCDIIGEAGMLLEPKAARKIMPLFLRQMSSDGKNSRIRAGSLIRPGRPSLQHERFVC